MTAAASPPGTPTSPVSGAGPKDPLLTGDAQLPLVRADPPLIKAFKDALQTIINVTDEWILYPDTRLYIVWQVFVMGASIMLAILVPYVVAFSVDVSLAIIFIYVAWCFQLLDMAVSFRTAFVNEEGQMVDDKHTLAMQYVKGGRFFIDLIANAPLNWFSSDPYMARLLLLNRVVSLNKALFWIRREEMKLTGSLLVQGYKFFLILALVVHYYACMWWLIGLPTEGSMNPEDSTWSMYDKDRINSVNLHTPEMRKTQSIQYIYSAYWVINLVTVPGFADLEAPTFKEKLIGLVMFLSALILFGWVTASVTSILANRDSQRSRYQQKLLSVRQYMDHNKFDATTRKRVSNYYDYLWKRNKGIDAKTIFNDLPTTFQAELALGINGHIISKVPLFQDTEIGFMRMLSLALQPVLFLPNEYVVKKGDIGSEMFFLHAGRVDVVSEDGKQVFATMQEGSFFGEIALFLSRPRTASIRAATYTDIYVLSKQNLDEVLAFYPAVRERIMAAAQERLRENLSRQQNNAVAAPPPPTATPADSAAQPQQQIAAAPAGTPESAPPASGANDSNGTAPSGTTDTKSSGTLPSSGDIAESNGTSPVMPRADRSASNNHLVAKTQRPSVSMSLHGSNMAVAQRISAAQQSGVSSSVSIGPQSLAAHGRPRSSNLGLGIPQSLSGSKGASSRNQLLGSILDMGGVVDEENSELVLPDSLFGMKIMGMSKSEIGKRESSDVLAIKSSTMALDESNAGGSVHFGPIGNMLRPGGGSGTGAAVQMGASSSSQAASQLRSSINNMGSFVGRSTTNVAARRSSMFPSTKPSSSNSSIGGGVGVGMAGGGVGGNAVTPAPQANRRRSLQVANSAQFTHSGSSSPVSQVMSRANTSGNAGSQGMMNRASPNRSSERVSETPGAAGPPSPKPSPAGSRRLSFPTSMPASGVATIGSSDTPATPPGGASRRAFRVNDVLAGTAFSGASPIEDVGEEANGSKSAVRPAPNGS